jgi:vitamin B12 transporter
MKKQKIYTIFFYLFLFAVYGAQLNAEEDSTKTYYAEDVVVTATRVSQPSFHIGRSINVISKEELQTSSLNSIGDVLSKNGVGFIAGATLNPGMQRSLFMRGANSNHTTILFDDIRLTDPSSVNNAPNLVEVSLADAEQVEIVRGSHSTMYGSSAIGGVVNIISRANQLPGLHADVELTAGTFGNRTSNSAQNIFLNYTVPVGFYVNAAIANSVVNGLDATIDTITNPAIYKNRDRDGFNNLNLVGKIGFRNEDWDLHVSYLHVNERADIDKRAFEDEDNARLDFERHLWTFGASFKINDEVGLKYMGGYSPIRRHAIDDSSVVDQLGTTDHSFTEDTYRGITSSHELLIDVNMSMVHAVFGLGAQRESMTQQSYLYQGSSSGVYESITNLDTLNLNSTLNHIFIHTEFKGTIVSEKLRELTVALGARLNQHSTYGNNTTYEINPYYEIWTNSLLFISYSTGFNAPSLYQLFCPTTYYTSNIMRGNKDLKPETSSSLEFGWKYRFSERANLSISYFHTVVENAIEYVYLWDKDIGLDTLGNDWMRDDYRGDTYLNVGTQNTSGWDIAFDLHLTDALSLSGSASIVRGRLTYKPENIQDKHVEGNHVQLYSNGAFLTREVETTNLVRRPSLFNASISYRPIADLLTKIDIEYVGSRYDAYYNTAIGPWGALDVLKIDDYTLVDCTVRYEFNDNLSVSIRMENVFDTRYSEILGFTTKGRAIYLGTRVSF